MGKTNLDITSNRSATKYRRSELLRRVVWGLVHPFFRFSPRTFFGWRRFLLRLLGAKIGNEVHVYSSATIYMPWNLEVGDWSSIGEHVFIYNLGNIRIGSKTTVSHRSHLCAGTHDYTDPTLPILKPPIIIGDSVWVCTDAFVGPGVTIGEGSVVGTRSVVVKDIDPWVVVAGNPTRTIKARELRD